jgi:hypothetical protein
MEGSAGAHRLRRAAAASTVLAGLAATGCGSSLFATTTTTATPSTVSTTTTTAPQTTGVGVGIPVTACSVVAPPPPTASTGGPGGSPPTSASPNANGGTNNGNGGNGNGGSNRGSTTVNGWLPSLEMAPIPTALVSLVAFYSDGVHTVLGPSGWTCNSLTPSPGETEVVVYPSGDPDPPTSGTPPPGSQGVFAFYANTAKPQGVALVCPFFTVPSWQARETFCVTGHLPAGEQTSQATPDVASVTDGTGVLGTLPGSGGPHPVTGVVIFPQVPAAVQFGQALNVVEEACSLTSPSLCPTVLSDFEVRQFPVPAAGPG